MVYLCGNESTWETVALNLGVCLQVPSSKKK